MSTTNRVEAVRRSLMEIDGADEFVPINEFRELANAYIELAERFDKVLEISDKFQVLISSVEQGEFGPGERSTTNRKRSVTPADNPTNELIERILIDPDAGSDARSLAKRYRRLESRLSKIMSISDVYQSQLRSTTLRLEQMARTDVLTELANRRDMTERLVMESARSARHGQPYGVGLFDIDNFKRINDTRGHDVGDRVLIEIAKTLRSVLRTSDVCARWGGEEFLVLCPATDASQVLTVAEKCRVAVESLSINVSGSPLGVTVSGGVSSAAGGSDNDWEELVRRADVALYEAKFAGKNRIVTAEAIKGRTTPPHPPATPPAPPTPRSPS
jgi:diguanylate cyclase